MTKANYSKIFSFIAFTLAAAVLWFLFRYNNTYVENTTISVEWVNVPKNIELSKESKELKIPIKVQANGFMLLWFNYGKANTQIDFSESVKFTKEEFVFYPKNARNAIDEIVGDDITVIEIDEQPIRLTFERFASRKVTLNQKFKVNFNGNYQMIGEGGFNVDTVMITGNDGLVERLDMLDIELKDIEVKDSLIVKEIDLNKFYPDLRIEPQQVTYTIHAAQMTEGSLRIPISILNKPEETTVKLIPEIVTVVFSSRLRDYNFIKASDFTVTVDMGQFTSSDATAVPVIKFDSPYINEARAQPQSVQILVIQ